MGQTIGIDFGTTNTVVSYVNKKGKIISLKSRINNSVTIPSAVYYSSEDDYDIGEIAIQKSQLNPRGLVTSFKSDIASKTKRVVTLEDGSTMKISSKKVAQHFLNKVLLSIQDVLIRAFGAENGYIEKAVITVPAKFSPTEKEQIKKSALKAGFKSVDLAYEPTSAAASYQNEINIQNNTDNTILVYDFGGGTFDVSVVKAIKKNDSIEYRELQTSGNKSLGGNDITIKIVEDIIEQVNGFFGLDLELDTDKKGLYRYFDRDLYDGMLSYEYYYKNIYTITNCAETLKIALSQDDEYTETIFIHLNGDVQPFEVYYSKQEFEDIILDSINKTVDITKKIINDLNADNIKIDEVVLAGGSSNIQMIPSILQSKTNLKVCPSDDFSTLISKGAVILNQNNCNKVTQITNNEYGIIVKDGRIFDKFEMLIPLNVKLPYTIKKSLFLNVDGQDSIEFKIYERDIQNYPKSTRLIHDGIELIDTVQINKLPKNLSKDNTRIDLNLTLNEDGSISVSADLCVDNKILSKSIFDINKESNLE